MRCKALGKVFAELGGVSSLGLPVSWIQMRVGRYD